MSVFPAGSLKWEDYSPDWPGQKVRLYLQNDQYKKGWRCGSGSQLWGRIKASENCIQARKDAVNHFYL
jgi:hypothetical protein